MGLDWGAIRADYEAQLDAQESAGLDPIERSELRRREREQRGRAASRQRERRASRTPKPRTTKYDHSQIVSLYRSGLSMKAVAREIGCDQWTVSKVLKAKGVELMDHSRAGAPIKTRCVRDHDMSKTRRRTPQGLTYCYKCVTERSRERNANITQTDGANMSQNKRIA